MRRVCGVHVHIIGTTENTAHSDVATVASRWQHVYHLTDSQFEPTIFDSRHERQMKKIKARAMITNTKNF